MRRTAPLLCLSIVGLLAVEGGPAAAQVTVDLHALNSAPAAHPPAEGTEPHHKPPVHHAPHHTARSTHAPAKPTAREAEKPAAPTKPVEPAKPAAPTPPTAAAPGAPAVPSAPAPPGAPRGAPPAAPPAAVVGLTPPPAVVIPAPAPADAPMPPPPPPPISATAGTTVAPLPKIDGTGVRLDFTGTEADLTPGSADAVKALVAAAPPAETTSFNVVAYATGTADDPSAARRLSLSRALAVRSALIASGVPSTRIYVRALGAPPPDAHPTATGTEKAGGPADRVDVIVLGANAAGPPPGGAAPPTHSP
jgi:outer membrane protein OmpA-like peptidoglycan-associated protein